MFEIARVHPKYGYPRTTAELRARGIHVNHKVIERLHSYWDLSVLKNIKQQATLLLLIINIIYIYIIYINKIYK